MSKVSESTIENLDDETAKALRAGYNHLASLIAGAIPPGRRRSIALTDLETSSMYAMKAHTVGDN